MSRKSFSITDESGTPHPNTTHPQMRRSSRWDPQFYQMSQHRRMSMMSRTSISGASQTAKPPPRYENTYKIEPDFPYKDHLVKKVMEATLREYLAGDEYSPNVRRQVTGISEEIKKRVKGLGFSRYKFVVTVTICQDAKQSMQMVSRCLWNKDTDNFTQAIYKTADIHAVATLYACYFE